MSRNPSAHPASQGNILSDTNNHNNACGHRNFVTNHTDIATGRGGD